jgi:hypothetical protein
MASTLDHACFVAPEDKNVKIWRYMEFTKFVSLLESKSLFLSRADKFEDKYEGSWSKANLNWLPRRLVPDLSKIDPDSELVVSARELAEKMRAWTYVNCWHINERESAAMWKLYSRTDEAVAIQSTYLKLHHVLPEDTYLGKVKYIDYDVQSMPEGNLFWPYVHKRLSFEHERELRIVSGDVPITEKGGFDVNKVNEAPGKFVDVDLEILIENIYVSPTAPTWFFELVQSVVKRYEHSFKVSQSDIARAPVF